MRISVLAENHARKRGMLAEHGLSLFIEHEGARILFDSGQTDVYLKNAAKIGIDVSSADFVVLSHGHYDHCGGLAFFSPGDKRPPVYINEAAFERRWVKDDAGLREIGIPWKKESLGLEFKTRESPARGITLCSGIPLTVDFEKAPQNFLIGEDKRADDMRDEQIMIIETPRGLAVFLGCSHPGAVNSIEHARRLFPGRPIDAVIGGMHLGDADIIRVKMTAEYFKRIKVRRLLPMHCTGIFSICEMSRALGDRCAALCAGDTIEI